MTTSNDITYDHYAAFFSLDQKLTPLDLAPTATGGAGLPNINVEPEPQLYIPSWKNRGTEYVKKYLEQEANKEAASRIVVELGGGSTFSINTLDDVEGRSSVFTDVAPVADLDSEATEQIYSTYFEVSGHSYNVNLPIYNYREEILQQMDINPVIIIQGPTGCGKTTQVPQYILDYHQAKGTYCNILVTQPRKLAAISIARRVCQERNWDLGTIVGYQVAMDPKVSTDTRLRFVTTGVFLEKLVNAKRMDMFTHVILDEVHERDQDTDFALLLVKKFLYSNSHRVKVILMSATFDSSSFATYFTKIGLNTHPAPIIDVLGKSKEVTEHYLDELKTLMPMIPEFDLGTPCLHPSLYDVVLKLMCVFDRIEKAEQDAPAESEYAPSRGAVLIFLPGIDDIRALSSKLQTASLHKNYWIIPLHSTITVEEQTKVFRDAPPNQRKVILSTNIAESSITVPDVKYVVDFCLTKNLCTDPVTNYSCLKLEWASKANCTQRRGRAGRVDIGKVYRMVPRTFYHTLQEYGIPEIKRCPLTKTILHLKKLNLCEPQELLAFALDPPDISDIGSAVIQLKEALALMHKGYAYDGDLTFIGRVMANLPLDIKLSKLIIFGYIFHCLEDCIIIAASLSLQSFFIKTFHQKALDAYRSRLSWANYSFSDCFCFLNAFKIWKQKYLQGFFRRPGGMTEANWAEKHFIQLKRIREVDLLVKEIKQRLETFKIFADSPRPDESASNCDLILKMVIAGAFFPNYFLQTQLDEETINRELNENDPHSTVVVSGLPPKHGILYASALKDMFISFSPRMTIEFEETKAYIKFERSRETTTSTVLQAVYLALKMRKLGAPLTIPAFTFEEAERRCHQLLAAKSNPNENQMVSNRITVTCNESSVRKAKLPSFDTDTQPIYVCHVNNCGHFWARLTYQRKDLDFLVVACNGDKGRHLKPLRKPPELNTFCLAPYSDQKYYRSLVQEIRKDKAKVFFVDFGNVEVVNVNDLREISERTPDVLTMPATAFECNLAGVKPPFENQWSPEADTWFRRTVNGDTLHAEIYSIVQDTVRVDLKYMDKQLGMYKSVKEELIRMKWAIPAEEPLISKQNHEQRKAAQGYHSDHSNPENFFKDLELSLKEAEGRSLRRTGRTIRLKGPENPLEVTYYGITSINNCKKVKISSESVNSVSINPDPQDPCSSLLVGASLAVGQHNNELMVRNTTLMPKIRGLPSLVCLLFAPNAEIRANKTKTAYAGALCGLGADPKTGYPVHPDHDIELPFDVKLDINDIGLINTIRMGFNMVLKAENDTLQFESTSMGVIHQELRNAILMLLKISREPKEVELYRKQYQWNQIPPGETDEAEYNSDQENCPRIMPLLKLPSLVNQQLTTEELMEHIKTLHITASSHTSRELKVIDCKLCEIRVNSTRDLLLHLDSAEHEKRENLLTLKYQKPRS